MLDRKLKEYWVWYSKTLRYIDKQLELGIECSVKDNLSVKEALISAQNMVLYPLSHLLNKENKTLMPNFVRAITRIFRILDTDNDGWLTDNDIINLQERVFKLDLTEVQLKEIKDSITQDLEDNSTSYGINLAAFQIIFRKSLDMLKIKNCWVSLSEHSYAFRL